MEARKKVKAQLESCMKLSLGGGPLGGLYKAVDKETAIATIDAAWQAGVRYFDVAPLYGCGEVEKIMGEALQKYPRDQYVLSTKVGRIINPDGSVNFDYSYDGIMQSYQASLKRLKLKPDILFVHDLGVKQHGERHKQMLEVFKESGSRALEELCSGENIAIGLGVNEIEVCLEVMSFFTLDFILLAGRYTLLEQDALKRFFPECARQNIGVISAAPYNSGILTDDPANKHYDYTAAKADIIQRANQIKSICSQFKVKLAHAAIQFPSFHPQVISTLVGASSPEEIVESAQNFKKPISSYLWYALKQAGLLSKNAPIETQKEYAKNVECVEQNVKLRSCL